MRYPALVRDRDCQTDIEITVYTDDISEDGEPVTLISRKLKCNYQSTGLQRYDAEHHIVEVKSVALINGDPLPEIANVTGGTAIIFGEEREIYQCSKERNPDGTVNYIRVELK